MHRISNDESEEEEDSCVHFIDFPLNFYDAQEEEEENKSKSRSPTPMIDDLDDLRDIEIDDIDENL